MSVPAEAALGEVRWHCVTLFKDRGSLTALQSSHSCSISYVSYAAAILKSGVIIE